MMTAQTKALVRTYFPYYKWSMYALLGLNMLVYLVIEGRIEAFEDSFGYLVLLLLFEYETSTLHESYNSKLQEYAIRIATFIAYGIVIVAAIEYSQENVLLKEGPLDMWNSWTWIVLIALLEYDVYAPGYYARWEWYLRNGAKVILYSALSVYAVLWGVEGRFFDFWDAFLWILCFFSIEMNIINFEEDQPFEDEVTKQH